MYYEVKSKISSTLIQLTTVQISFNETKRTALKLVGLEKREEYFEQ